MILKTITRNFWFALPAIMWVWCCVGSGDGQEAASADKVGPTGSGDEKDSSKGGGSEEEPPAKQTLTLDPGLWDGSGRASRAPSPTKVLVRSKLASLALTGWPTPEGSLLDRLVACSRRVTDELSVLASAVRSHAPPARA